MGLKFVIWEDLREVLLVSSVIYSILCLKKYLSINKLFYILWKFGDCYFISIWNCKAVPIAIPSKKRGSWYLVPCPMWNYRAAPSELCGYTSSLQHLNWIHDPCITWQSYCKDDVEQSCTQHIGANFFLVVSPEADLDGTLLKTCYRNGQLSRAMMSAGGCRCSWNWRNRSSIIRSSAR